MKNFISWISFCFILFVYGTCSIYCGALVANYLQDNVFHFHGWWCLLNAIPLFIVGFLVAIFLTLGLKKFGEAQ